jgi:acetyl esterase/lipase
MRTYRGRQKFYPVEVLRDLVYSHAGGKPRLADLYLPTLPHGHAPVIVWLHGGGFRFGDRRMAPDLAQFLAARGFAMVSFDYRLSDEAIFPAAVEDTKTLVRWVRSIAKKHGLDGEKLGLWGSSAGSHLAACAALSQEDEFAGEEHPDFSSKVQAVLDGYGPVDFGRIDQDRIPPDAKPVEVESVSVPNLLPAGHPDSFESRFLGTPVGSSGAAVARANPANYVRSGAPPFLMLHGLHDPLMPWQQSRILFDALRDAGNDATLLVIQRLGHGFFNNSRLDHIDPGEVMLHQTEAAAATAFGSRIPQISFGFDLVEEFFRSYLTGSDGTN